VFLVCQGAEILLEQQYPDLRFVFHGSPPLALVYFPPIDM
jgi:hypothetical protein